MDRSNMRERVNIGLRSVKIETPLGFMTAIADEESLFYLGFTDSPEISPGNPWPIRLIEQELKGYFEGTLKAFQTPCVFRGTPFQQKVWEELKKIPLGETRSYVELASAVGKPSACRAVAQANGRNAFCIVVPCHRVIYANGDLGGYSSGLARKEWLLGHEGIILKNKTSLKKQLIV
jgi:AraC family transcriptional regulator of adaptative response/methylated-DNA-[protein]-cysteine methyltransferase